MVKIKKIAMKLLGLCLLLLAVVSCQQDDLRDYEPGTKEHENISSGTVQTKIYNQQQVDEKFSFELFQSRDGGGGKTVFSASNYSIVTDYIKSVESDKLHTLTYLVEYKDDPDLFVNLVFYSYDYKAYTPFILRYDIKKSDYKEGMQIPKEKINYIPVNRGQDYGDVLANVKSLPGFTTDDCIDIEYIVVEHKCAEGIHSPGEEQLCAYTGEDAPRRVYLVTFDISDCFKDDGGGGSTPIGGESSLPGAGSGGSTGGMGGEDLGWVSPGEMIPIDDITPGGGELVMFPNTGDQNMNRKTLRNLVNNNLTYIQTLYNNRNDTREHGYAFTKQTINGQPSPFANSTALQLSNGSDWSLDIKTILEVSNYTGLMHTHTNPNYKIVTKGGFYYADPMFSHTDIWALFRLSRPNNAINKELAESFMGLITGESMYVLMFPNDTTLANFASKHGKGFSTMTKDKEFWEKVGEKLRDEYKKIVSSSDAPAIKKQKYEKALLKVLKKQGIPLNFYRLDANGGQFNGQWKLLRLDNNGSITEN